LEDAKVAGADLMVVACPLCHSNLDMRQPNIERFAGRDLRLPVLYITQLLGLALGHSAREMGLSKHIIDPVPVLRERGFDV
jgi:heterodisulfide reductase subunit B